MLDKYTVFGESVKTIFAPPEIAPSSDLNSLFTGVSSPNVANIPAIWSYTLKVSDLRFQASFNKTNLAMKSTQIPPSVIVFRPRSNGQAEKSKHLTLNQISELMAHAAVMTKNDLSEATKSQIYATDRDEFLDFNAHQSVNTNPSTNTGVCA